MSRIECNILGVIGEYKRLLTHLVFSVIVLALMPGLEAQAQTDSWRRTANGWERTESWDYLVTAPVGKLRPLTADTLVQRTWPAAFAAVELSLVLLILHFGSGAGSTSKEQAATTSEP